MACWNKCKSAMLHLGVRSISEFVLHLANHCLPTSKPNKGVAAGCQLLKQAAQPSEAWVHIPATGMISYRFNCSCTCVVPPRSRQFLGRSRCRPVNSVNTVHAQVQKQYMDSCEPVQTQSPSVCCDLQHAAQPQACTESTTDANLMLSRRSLCQHALAAVLAISSTPFMAAAEVSLFVSRTAWTARECSVICVARVCSRSRQPMATEVCQDTSKRRSLTQSTPTYQLCFKHENSY